MAVVVGAVLGATVVVGASVVVGATVVVGAVLVEVATDSVTGAAVLPDAAFDEDEHAAAHAAKASDMHNTEMRELLVFIGGGGSPVSGGTCARVAPNPFRNWAARTRS
jgi:hypothetical protein